MREGWSEVSLGEICNPKQWTTIGGKDLLPEGYPVFGANGFIGFYSKPNHLEDTVVITCRGATCGEVSVVPGPSYITGNAMCLDDVREDIVLKTLLAEIIRFTGTQKIISGSAQPQIVRGALLNFKISLPPLPEQRKIAEILRTWDEALEKLNALRAAKARRLEGIAQRLLAPSRAIGRGVPQSNWTPSSFGEVFEERQDKNAGLSTDDVVTVGKYAIRKQSEHFTRSVASKDLSNYWTISPGDFVYDPMSAYYGAIGRYAGSADGIVSPAYRVIKLSPDVDPEFMVALLRTHHVRFLLETRSSQGNKEGKRRLLQRDEFESIEFKLPPREAQREIAAKLAVFRTDLELTEREIEALTRQKRGLMQKLLTGEWRVNTTEATEVAQ